MNGDRYEGDFKKDMYDGFGTMKYSIGHEYIGMW